MVRQTLLEYWLESINGSRIDGILSIDKRFKVSKLTHSFDDFCELVSIDTTVV